MGKRLQGLQKEAWVRAAQRAPGSVGETVTISK